MPRPKVLPSQRQRAFEACGACRESKKRCSGTAPCTHCLRRGLGSSCLISNRPRAHRRTMSGSAAAARSHLPATTSTQMSPSNTSPSRPPHPPPPPHAQTQVTVSSLGAPRRASSPANKDWSTSRRLSFRPISPSESREAEPATSTSRSADGSSFRPSDDTAGDSVVSPKPLSRMLLNLRGERVYIGRGGSLSFLHLVRNIVSDQIGPSQFSGNGKTDTMLEKESPQSSMSAPSLNDMSVEARLMCADYFYAVTGGLIDVFLPGEIEGLLKSPTHLTRQSRTMVDLVVAIGLQCDPSTDTHDREMAYFRESQNQAFSGMLEDPDIDMVRTFIIMTFYLLGECRRNTAFLYLGIAARAAVALGLHSYDTYTDMNDPIHQLRLRVWMSLRVLDIVVNSILGRPAATAGMHPDVQGLIDDAVANSHDRGIICLGASYGAVTLINTIVDKLYGRKEITISAAEEYLQELDRWSQSLPDFLRTPPSTAEADVSADKGAIGRVHVSCIYYFAVTLVTRPILVSVLTHPSSGNMVHSQLASACLDAAMFIVQTCSGARELKLLQANMCILKAIIFLAGLVLGFEVFAKSTVDFGIESGFHGSRDLLSFLGVKSPQAALYYDILTSLGNAISEYRKRALGNGKSSYVSKIFNFGQGQTGGRSSEAEQQVDGTGSTLAEQRSQMDDILAGWSYGQNTPVGSGEMFLDWDSLDISQWDSFPYIA